MSNNPYRHYYKDVSHLKEIDVYRVLDLFAVTDPCIQHAVKKLLCAGQRGSKDPAKDVHEALVTLQRYEEMRKENRASGYKQLQEWWRQPSAFNTPPTHGRFNCAGDYVFASPSTGGYLYRYVKDPARRWQDVKVYLCLEEKFDPDLKNRYGLVTTPSTATKFPGEAAARTALTVAESAKGWVWEPAQPEQEKPPSPEAGTESRYHVIFLQRSVSLKRWQYLAARMSNDSPGVNLATFSSASAAVLRKEDAIGKMCELLAQYGDEFANIRLLSVEDKLPPLPIA